MKEHEKWKKNEPSLTSMRQTVLDDIPFQSKEFEQDGRRHVAHF